MDYPEYIKINNKKYKINTSYKIAIECNKIAENENISDQERALAIIYKLYGDEGLYDYDNYSQLLELAIKYLGCGKEITNNKKEKKDMDFQEDIDYIKASFRSDYNIDLNKEDMHWWEFYNLVCGLSYNEFGNCCVLNRIRMLRNANPNEIKDIKERNKLIEAQKSVELKSNKKEFTQKQKDSINNFLNKINYRKE